MSLLSYGSFASPEAFVQLVADLRPRTAAFDCDGTLWFGDSGMDFFYWEIEQGLLPTKVVQAAMERYDGYLAGRVSEDEICGEMVQIHRGLSQDKVANYAERFAKSNVVPHYFPEMANLVRKLQDQGCDIWAVSSTNSWVIEAAVHEVGIPGDRVLAVRGEVENGMITDRLGGITSGPGKAVALKQALNAPPDVSFGNAIFDLEMLELARHPFAINPSADLRRIAEYKGWRVYQPRMAKITSSTA
jgi:Phosphoserine phosphatase